MYMSKIFKRVWRCALLAALEVGCSLGVYSATYSLRDLGPLVDLPGVDESHPNAVGPESRVVGSNALAGYYRAFLLGDALLGLGTLGGGESFAADINRHGVIVGFSHSPSAELRGFIWTEGGTDGVPDNPEMRELGTFGGSESQALGINDSGHVTGYAETTKRARAFIYRDGTMTDIGDSIGGLPNSFGFGINELDHVAGAAYNAGYSSSHAFLHDGQTGMLLGDLGGGESFALGLNDEDHVVGYSLLEDGLHEHAFLFRSGTLEDLGTLGGGYSYAFAINNINEIVGGSFVDAQNATYHAFICRDGVMEDLNGMLDASGDGWVLMEARAINDLGQIAGEGELNAEKRGFLLTPDFLSAGPLITDVVVEDNDVLVTFLTTSGVTYALEATTQTTFQGWSVVAADVPGTGEEVTVPHPNGAGQVQRFYRVALTRP
jgi:probable HAF family extracellular repeat protein